MDAHCGTSLAKIQPRLHAGRNSPNLAMVGAVAAPVSECDRRYFGNFPGSSSISGISWRKCRDSCWYGWSSEHRQRFRKSLLGLGIRFAHTTSDVHRNVPGPGASVLRPSRNKLGEGAVCGRVFDPHVLRRRVRNYAGLRCRLLRIQERWPHLRSYAHGMGFRERIRPTAHRVHSANNWLISWSAPRYRGDYGGFDALAFRCSSQNGSRAIEQVLPNLVACRRPRQTQTALASQDSSVNHKLLERHLYTTKQSVIGK